MKRSKITGILLSTAMMIYVVSPAFALDGRRQTAGGSRDKAVFRIDQPKLNINENPYRFSSYYGDQESDNYYLNARYYRPQMRSFISRDTYDLSNRYAYCSGEPVSQADPSGHMAWHLSDIIGAAISFVPVVGSIYAAVHGVKDGNWIEAGLGVGFFFFEAGGAAGWIISRKVAERASVSVIADGTERTEDIGNAAEAVRENPLDKAVRAYREWEAVRDGAQNDINRKYLLDRVVATHENARWGKILKWIVKNYPENEAHYAVDHAWIDENVIKDTKEAFPGRTNKLRRITDRLEKARDELALQDEEGRTIVDRVRDAEAEKSRLWGEFLSKKQEAVRRFGPIIVGQRFINERIPIGAEFTRWM